MIKTVSLDQIPTQPWRNGGGSTQELLTWPGADNWLVRISVARIERNGPFSAFPDIERWFAVIHGDGVLLRVGPTNISLLAGTEPHRFDGAIAPECELLGGATQDLNLMVRRDRGVGDMRPVIAGEALISAGRLRAVYTAQPAILVIDEQPPIVLPANTLAWNDDAAGQRWQLSGAAASTHVRAWWLAFAELSSPPLPHAN